MQVSKVPAPYQPVTITLETEEEFNAFYCLSLKPATVAKAVHGGNNNPSVVLENLLCLLNGLLRGARK